MPVGSDYDPVSHMEIVFTGKHDFCGRPFSKTAGASLMEQYTVFR